MDNHRVSFGLIAVILLFILGLVGLTWANYRFTIENPGGNDFLARWMGARFWVKEGVSPYDPSVSLETQEQIYGRPADAEKGEDIAHFVYPLHSMLFFAPFALVDYSLARALWMTTLEISTILLVIVSLRLARWSVSPVKLAVLVLFALFWYHGVRTIVIGQFAAIGALLIALALLCIQRQYDFAAGVLLALSTAKPQMVFLLIPFVLLWAFSVRRWELFWGTLLTFFLLIFGSLILLPSWPMEWLRQLLEYPSYTHIGSPLSVITDLMPGIRSSLNLFLHALVGAALLIEWILAWGKSERWFLWTALMTMVVTNLVAFRTATTNFVMLVPVLFLVFKLWEERWRGGGRWAIRLSLLFLGIGLWAIFLLTVEGNVEQPVMYLPLPFFCLLGLWWVRWWAIRPPRVLLDGLVEKFG